MKNVRVVLVPKYMTKEELKEIGIEPAATVEAEYGDKVITGEQITLAHHTKEYANNPAPCNTPNVPVLEDGATIVVSHVDLDTLGGIAALLGRKKEDPDFWNAAEFIDLNGIHHLHEISPKAQKQYLAYSAWCEQNRSGRITEVTDITQDVMEKLAAMDKSIDMDQEMVENGIRWSKEQEQAIEACLIFENENIRVFDSPEGIFCSAEYYSPKQERIIPATVVLNGKFKSITVALADGGKEFQKLGLMTAKELVQKIWGPEAGGHPGIAGSPRGKEMDNRDLDLMAITVNNEFLRAQNKKMELTEEEYEEIEELKSAVSLRSISDRSDKVLSAAKLSE